MKHPRKDNYALVTAWQPRATKKQMSKSAWQARFKCSVDFVKQAVKQKVNTHVVVDKVSYEATFFIG